MKKLTVPVFLVLSAYALSRCFPAGSGGNTTALFYCTEPGCASNAYKVFCNDESVPLNPPMEECTGPPPPNTVCQRGGRAFVSTNTSGTCDFEADSYIQTKRCTDNPDMCDFTSGTTPSPLTVPESRSKNQKGPGSKYILIVPGAVLALVLLVCLYKMIRNRSNQQPQG